MSNTVILTYYGYARSRELYNELDLIRDIMENHGTINSLGHRWDIIVTAQSALLLLLKYPDLQIHSTQPPISDFREITVRIA